MRESVFFLSGSRQLVSPVTRALGPSLTEHLQSDDFILAQPLAGLVVCEPSRVEEPTLDTLPAAEGETFLEMTFQSQDFGLGDFGEKFTPRRYDYFNSPKAAWERRPLVE